MLMRTLPRPRMCCTNARPRRVPPLAFVSRNAQGKPQLGTTFKDGASQTILFAEKYASAWISAEANGTMYKGGCNWAYFQWDCQNPFFAFVEPAFRNRRRDTDLNAVGPTSMFQVQPSAAGGCNPCLPATIALSNSLTTAVRKICSSCVAPCKKMASGYFLPGS